MSNAKIIAALEKIQAAKQTGLMRGQDMQKMRQEESLMNKLIDALATIGNVTSFTGPQGPKGDKPLKGYDYFTEKEIRDFLELATPVKGKDYFTKQEIMEIIDIVTPKKGEDYTDGEDGYTPKKGVDYFDGEDGVANMDEVTGAIDECMGEHMKACNHALIHDPKMLGEYELDVSTLKDGDILQVKGKKLVGVKIQMPDINSLRGWVSSQGVSNIRHATVTSSQSLEPFVRWIVDATTGDITLTIPSAQGRESQWFEIMRIDGTANTVTILPTGSETFSDMSSYLLQQWTNFQIFGYNNNYLIRQAI